MKEAVETVPPLAKVGCSSFELVRLRDVHFEDIGFGWELAGGPTSEGQPATSSREDYLGPLLLSESSYSEGQGGLREDAGDEEPLTLEKSHEAGR